MSSLALTFEDVVQAHARIVSVVHRTPVLTSGTANKQIGASCFFKCENFQRTGAFKFRGAYNALSRLTPQQRARGVVAYSSGNHAQAVALAAQLFEAPSTIIMPNDAPHVKVEATRGYGSHVIFYDRYTEDREALGRALADEKGLTLIPPYDHPHVMAGQGTVAKEFFEEVGPLDFLLVPLGGGGLLSGCAVVAKHLHPQCTVIGVEPEAGNDAQRSLREGKIVHIDTPTTLADGAQTQHVGMFTFPVLQQRVDEVLTVSDAALVHAMRFFASRMKIVVEPTGCLGAAAALGGTLALHGKRVGCVVSGGNIGLQRFSDLTCGDF